MFDVTSEYMAYNHLDFSLLKNVCNQGLVVLENSYIYNIYNIPDYIYSHVTKAQVSPDQNSFIFTLLSLVSFSIL